MKSSFPCLVPLLLISAVTPFETSAQEFKTGSLVVERPWSRATAGGAKVGAGYMTITNTGSESDRFIGGSLRKPAASRCTKCAWKTA